MVLNTDDGCDVVVAAGPDVDGAVAFYTDGCSEMVEDLLPDGCRCVYPPARMVRDAAEDGGLIVAKDGGRIVAACILNRSPDDAYLCSTHSACPPIPGGWGWRGGSWRK